MQTSFSVHVRTAINKYRKKLYMYFFTYKVLSSNLSSYIERERNYYSDGLIVLKLTFFFFFLQLKCNELKFKILHVAEILLKLYAYFFLDFIVTEIYNNFAAIAIPSYLLATKLSRISLDIMYILRLDC